MWYITDTYTYSAQDGCLDLVQLALVVFSCANCLQLAQLVLCGGGGGGGDVFL